MAAVGEFERVVESWDGEQVLVRFDAPTGTWIFICIHSRRLGPAAGGTRMKVYESTVDALRDGTRLAAGMTVKMAVAGFSLGGGKAVLAVPALLEGNEREGLFRRYSEAIASLGGSFWTGCDMNTTPGDLDVIAERCPYVFGRSGESGGSGEPGPSTARGVLYGIQACLTHIDGSPSLEGRSVLVQGVGSVGARLSELLTEAGARVLVTDIAPERAEELGSVLARRLFSQSARSRPSATSTHRAPPVARSPPTRSHACAAALSRDRRTTSSRRPRTPTGFESGILYAPDFVINAPSTTLARRLAEGDRGS